MLESFKDVIQYESSKLITYKFVSAKLLDERMINRAKKLIINKFSKFDSSDEEFDKHLEEIETVPISDNVAIPIEKGPVGRHPQEQACNALVFSPEKRINGKPRGRPKGSGKSQGANNQIGLRRSQRNRK